MVSGTQNSIPKRQTCHTEEDDHLKCGEDHVLKDENAGPEHGAVQQAALQGPLQYVGLLRRHIATLT